MALLYGIHDREGRDIVPAGGWVLDTVALSENPAPADYAALRPDVNWIVRLNNAYGSGGTIPLPGDYQKFADACAEYVFRSNGANVFVVANEPNHENERPNGVYITPAQYADCFIKCRDAIKRARPQTQVLPAPCAPYHADPVNWLDYWREMLNLIADNGGCDGIPFHAYTRSSNPADITDPAKMGPPLETQYSGFLTYQDALGAVPLKLGYLPAYGTEFNENLPKGWDDANTGVVQAAYAEIDEWNKLEGRSPIQCLILYRWPKFIDRWYIEGKRGVIADFQAAVGRGYSSPIALDSTGAKSMPDTTYLPSISHDAPSSALPPRQIDPRATQRGVTVETPAIAPGHPFWFAKRINWLNEQESQGRHHIYGNAWMNGAKVADVPLTVNWPGGAARIKTEDKSKDTPPWDYWYNYPMTPSLSEFSIKVGDGTASETVKGIGMGADGNSHIHTCTVVEWELTTMPADSQPPQPEPPAPPTPTMGAGLLWPVMGPITQYFGPHGIDYPGVPGHDGLDFGVPQGTQVLAVADGKVMWVDNDPTGFGLYVRIYHPAYGFHSFMGHLSRQLVHPGQMVKRGEVVALSGSTGNSTGAHLHFSCRLGSENTYYDLHDGYHSGQANPLAVYALLNYRDPNGAQ